MIYQPTTLMGLLRYRADSQPSKKAYTFLQEGEREAGYLTYYDLDKKAKTIAGFLQSLKAKGERALLMYPQSLEFIAAFCGCLYAEVIAV